MNSKNRQTLSISQMEHLKKIGVDTNNASMALIYYNDRGQMIDWFLVDENRNERDIGEHNSYLRQHFGTFTIQDMLDILPQNIRSYSLGIEKTKLGNGIGYHAFFRDIYGKFLKLFVDDELKDALYQLLCWYYEEGYILNSQSLHPKGWSLSKGG